MKPLRMQKDGNRYCLWPIRLAWVRATKPAQKFFDRHGWQIGAEYVPEELTGEGCPLGFRKVFGQTFHIGALKIMCGPTLERNDCYPENWYESRYKP
jgi:hypothetical protein